MDFNIRERWPKIPSIWLIVSVLSAFGSGCCLLAGQILWLLLAFFSVVSAAMMVRSVVSLVRRVNYVMEATLSGDFSYKFLTSDVSREEKEINGILNRMVSHFEELNREARQNEVFLKRMIDLMDVGIAVADSNCDVILHNKAALKILDRQAFTHLCQLPEKGWDNVTIKQCVLTVRERVFKLLTFSDITRQIQAAEIESWEKLTRVLTHEIMNSLTPIQSIASNMQKHIAHDSTSELNINIKDAFETISSSSTGLMQFVGNFRELAKLPQPQMRAIYLKPLLEWSVRLGEEYARDRDIEIKLLCFPPDVMAYTDESLLGRVLLNIIKNAIDANPKVIKIETDLKPDETLEIVISNDGKPIADETAVNMFTPFFTTKESGNGIGLSLSRRIIAHLGGTLSFKTRPLTSFTIRL